MTQEHKELLLRDLSARLPYEVKAEYNQCACEVLSIDRFNEELTIRVCPGYCPDVKLEDVKPFLLPLSSIEEEKRNEFFDDLVKLEIKAIINEIDDKKVVEFEVDWYNKNHVDYRGLIEKGLAIDATGLNIY